MTASTSFRARARPANRNPAAFKDTATEVTSDSFDAVLVAIADFVCDGVEPTEPAYGAARLCMLDSIGCLAGALDDPELTPLLGPLVPGTTVPLGARVPGTAYVLDPVRAAFSTSALIRWLDFSDTTSRGGHPSDNIGAILACADYVSRRESGEPRLCMRDVFRAMARAYEIQGVISESCKLDARDVGLDAVITVKVASAAVAARLLGGAREHVLNAVSNAWIDGGTLNAYRQPPNSGTRKGWAGADAASRGVWFAMIAVAGEMGYPKPLSAKPWGFHEVYLGGRRIALCRPFASSVIENVIFKLSPCQRNGSTAVEAALALHEEVARKLDRVQRVIVHSHAEAIERIDRRGPLPNAAARDHCLQFMVSAAVVFGDLQSEHYREPLALDPRVESLRQRIEVVEDERYSRGYADPRTRSCGNAVEVEFTDGTRSRRVDVEFPGGDPSRRSAALPKVQAKFRALAAGKWPDARTSAVAGLLGSPEIDSMPVCAFMDLLTD
jgi:2-methylcitrate dehydratase